MDTLIVIVLVVSYMALMLVKEQRRSVEREEERASLVWVPLLHGVILWALVLLFSPWVPPWV